MKVELSEHEAHVLRTLVKDRLSYVNHELYMRELEKRKHSSEQLDSEIASFRTGTMNQSRANLIIFLEEEKGAKDEEQR